MAQHGKNKRRQMAESSGLKLAKPQIDNSVSSIGNWRKLVTLAIKPMIRPRSSRLSKPAVGKHAITHSKTRRANHAMIQRPFADTLLSLGQKKLVIGNLIDNWARGCLSRAITLASLLSDEELRESLRKELQNDPDIAAAIFPQKPVPVSSR